jgi:hypothetical protein
LATLLLILAIIKGFVWLICLLLCLAIIYLVWAIFKNYRYVNEWQAIFILPTLQLVADAAVISGTINGLVKIWDIKKMS